MPGILSLVSTPIGNLGDITLRAIETLKAADAVVCEEYKPAGRLLRALEIKKPLIAVNEHNEKEGSEEVMELLRQGKNLALISDAGSPVFSDPGRVLVEKCRQEKIRVRPLPGASSLIPALQMSARAVDRFHFAGWLSPKTEVREKELEALKGIDIPIVIMDTPYRLKQLLTSIAKIFPARQVSISVDISLDDEEYLRGRAEALLKKVLQFQRKRNFVLILE